MMARRHVALLAAAAALGCEDPRPPPADGAATASARAAGELAKGSKIVALTGESSFTAGEVTAVGSGKVTFELGKPDPKTRKRRSFTVDQELCWAQGNVARAEAGDHLVCRVPPSGWYPCKVLAVKGATLEVEDNLGKKHTLTLDAVVATGAKTRARIEQYLLLEEKRRAFDKAFLAAGAPYRPKGWEPKKGELVIVHFVGTSWYGATVVENKKALDKVRIDWAGDTWDDRDVRTAEVAPVTAAKLEAGQYVLVRPTNEARRWEPARVERVEGDTVALLGRDGQATKAAAKDVLPLVK